MIEPDLGRSLLLPFLIFSAACDGTVALSLDDEFWEGLPGRPPQVAVAGSIMIGDYPSIDGEVLLEVYASEDATRPIDTVRVGEVGGYYLTFGHQPENEIYTYWARAVSVEGGATQRSRLFPHGSGSGIAPGPDFQLPPYAPLAQPFVLHGRVVRDGAPVSGVEVTLPRRRSITDDPSEDEVVVVTGQNGVYRLETFDQAQRLSLCGWVRTATDSSGITVDEFLEPLPLDECIRITGRELPDLVIG